MTLPHPAPLSQADFSAVELMPGDDAVVMLDQRLLPSREEYVTLRTSDEVARAITDMVVRGAPAIGIAAAYGMVLASRRGQGGADLGAAAARLKAARPTAVNLAWAVDRMLRAAGTSELADEARRIHAEDVAACRRMGALGAALVPDGATILTHCNAGALATGGYGTALGVIRAAHDAGKRIRVFADETRPWLQGARLTSWELARSGIDVSLIADGAAGYFFSRGEITLAVVGADRIAENGDVANKIGTYGVACLAHHHGRPLYVAAPWSTVDLDTQTGAQILIEERGEKEVTHLGGQRIAPEGVSARNPAFDVTPAALVSAVVTERGVAEPVGAPALRRLAVSERAASELVK